jgi:hypothetical protein
MLRPGGMAGRTAGQSGGRGGATPARAGGGNTTGGNGTRFVDVALNSVLMAQFDRTAKQLADLMHNKALIPQGDNGTKVLWCLSYILRGECNTSCHQPLGIHTVLTQTEQSHVGEMGMIGWIGSRLNLFPQPSPPHTH